MAKRIAKKEDESQEIFTFFFGKDNIFSQWYHVEFSVDDVKYNCAEQYMMHQKAVLFGDDEMASQILESHYPKEQKAMGRKVKNFDPKVWGDKCMEIVKDGNIAKFSQNPELRNSLLATRGTTMVEASPYDQIWGIGLSVKSPRAHDRSQWKGKNLLGNILTEVREVIKSREDSH